MCEYCSKSKVILNGNTDHLNDAIFIGSDNSKYTVGEIKDLTHKIPIRVIFSNKTLYLGVGEDGTTLCHADDIIDINYCFMCGRNLRGEC